MRQQQQQQQQRRQRIFATEMRQHARLNPGTSWKTTLQKILYMQSSKVSSMPKEVDLLKIVSSYELFF